MNTGNNISLEVGKENFISGIRQLAVHNKTERSLVRSIREAELKADDIKSHISQTLDELSRSIFIGKTKKKEMFSHVASLEEKKDDEYKKIKELKDRITALRIESFGELKKPLICFGKYPYSEEGIIKKIEWDVLLVEENKALVCCSKIIDCFSFADEITDTTWAESRIRNWLNNDFFVYNFSEEEKKIIIESKNDNIGNKVYKTPGSIKTVDRIWIPSVEEARSLFSFDADRITCCTPYAKSRGLYENENTKGCYWWLRSNGGNLYNASVVNFKGYIFDYGFYVNSSEYGIRPFMWLDLRF